MIDFIEYVVSELKSRRLSKENAINLIRQFSANSFDAGVPSAIHPLLHRNVSDIYQQCYRSSFTGDEFFLRDHQVIAPQGEVFRVLPGVACLEMARAAVADALTGAVRADRIRIEDVVWIKPVVVTETKDVFIALAAGNENTDEFAIDYEIFSQEPDADGQGEDVLHCRGRAVFAAPVTTGQLDIEALTQRISAGQMDAAVVYPAYRRMGMQFGPGHQAVRFVLKGDREVLAQLVLPDLLGGTLAEYELHPSLMDGALQASVGLLGDLTQLPEQPSLPFALESLQIFSACRQKMYVWIRHAQNADSQDKVTKLDIDLCDEQGRVCVELRGFSSRTLAASPGIRWQDQSARTGLVLASPIWELRDIMAAARPTGGLRHHVLLCGLPDASVARLPALLPDVHCHSIGVDATNLAESFVKGALGCFEVVKKIIEDRTDPGEFVHIVTADGPGANLLVALAGLLKSASLENPEVKGQVLLLDRGDAHEELAARLRAEYGQDQDAVVRYKHGTRQVLAWQEIRDRTSAPPIAFKEEGVYLITGGLGGLGTLVAREILHQTGRARIVLTGRSRWSESIQEKLLTLGAANRIEYRSLDLTDTIQVRQLVDDIRESHGRLNGIIHSAGMIADNFIVRKTPEEFSQVLAPKVFGAVNLDAASQGMDLDFLVFFSSGAAVMGNLGQADYAVANGFLDQFADYRNRLAADGQRQGLTLSINWPFWRDGGMRMSEADQAAMRDATGMQAMETGSGLHAFYRCLETRQQQAVVIEGDQQKIRSILFGQARPVPAVTPVPAVGGEQTRGDLAEQTRDYLRKQFAALFKLPYAKVDPKAALEKYGIDSILAMDLTRQLEKTFGSLSKTLFFEYQTIDELTDYFLRSHGEKLGTLFKAPAKPMVPLQATPALTAAAPLPAARPGSRRRLRGERLPAAVAPSTDAHPSEAIAIVGLSGRYPASPDIEAFWDNLKNGRDCVTEIPRERWDWRDYYSEDRTAEGCHYSKWGGFINGVDEFDPLFFNIPPVDAEFLDPQERLFLQHAWMAVEDAGYTRAGLQTAHDEGLTGQVGVYVGVMYGEYQLFGAEASLQGRRIGVPVSYASIANRVSYVMNLQGPSMTLDTMCSSSLTAIHLACQDLKQGRTHLAIAGGVNVTIHPNKYLILSAGQYISGDGHCQSFGEGGDGYIPGEGVGAVILKRLSDAERDGNHIYGILKGSALNHGGKTNGYSVPNPKAQAAVIDRALQEYGIDPRHVSYIEAHGTGTKLGDPIEIAALSQIFRKATQERQFCAIGSAKSNIGHCESAAGIAGLTKVLLQMQHRMIAPSLHSSVLNPHIDFEQSPFVVNQNLRAWEQPVVDGKPVPRIAGISSFGAGGSNAHLIVEEYADRNAASRVTDIAAKVEAIVPLSARTAEQLRQKVRDLLAFLRKRESAVDLDKLAHTLQTGREAMAVRLAFAVDSVARLAEGLEQYERGEVNIDQCFAGQAETDADGMLLLSQDEDMMEAVDKWIARRKLPKLAELWVKGFDLDWCKLYTGGRPGLISLPTYPFARNRYWVAGGAHRGTASGAKTAVLHPLLHTNTSDFFQQSYACEFTGEEFFLADHQIAIGGSRRHRILPGVAYLEMARAAVDLAWPVAAGNCQLIIRHVVWARPIVVDGPTRVTIALSPEGDSKIDFEVLSPVLQGEEPIVHCQGRVEISSQAAGEALDVATLRSQMNRTQLTPERIYGAFEGMGIHYGSTFRCVAQLYQGQDQLLAELVLPAGADRTLAGFVLPPSLLDSALQAAIGLVADVDSLPDQPFVPFALDSLVFLAPCTPRMFTWVRYGQGDQANGIRKIDIDLCDENGRLCARLTGLAFRTLEVDGEVDRIGTLIANPHWETIPAKHASLSPAAWRRHLVVLAGLPTLDLGTLITHLPSVDVKRLPITAVSLADRYRGAALACFEELQTVLKSAPQEKVLFQLVIANEGDDSLLAGLAALMDSAWLENPRLMGQVILADSEVDEKTLAEQLRLAGSRPRDTLVKFTGDVLSVRRWLIHEAKPADQAVFKDSGVYLITGGLGGLGTLFAREILTGCADAVVILTGRADLDASRRAAFDQLAVALSDHGGRLLYRKLDLARLEEVEALMVQVYGEFGGLNGVIHSAGMIRDGLIIHKAPEEFAQVLEPKVAGTVHLDLATRDMPLDFLVLFSSLASAMGNVGQADYAAANGFMDQFAAYRNGLVQAGHRHGKTLSINWPLWQEGGMQLDEDTLQLLTRTSGMLPLPTTSGMAAFHRSFGDEAGQTLVVAGYLDRLRSALHSRHNAAPVTAPTEAAMPAEPESADGDMSRLLEKTQSYLGQQFASLLKIPVHEIDAKAPLEKYGMDSVLAMKLTNHLEQTFGSLSKTLFFEYQTIASLAAYLLKNFPAILQEKTGLDAAGSRWEAAQATPVANQPAMSLPRKLRFAELAAPTEAEVAIIGVAGRYPQARDLREFWQNLKSGRDCITEIPPERWDHQLYYHPERNQPGKTYSKWGGFLADVDQFDALFFNISPKEAELIDPQERLFIETVWETIEDAGYSKEAMARNRVGVYVGVMWGQYELYGTASAAAGVPTSSFASIANRVSYFFDFRGPSLALDTMCSSSLTAIHLAWEAVKKGAIDVAIAGGVNVSIHPSKYLSLSQGNFVSTDGRCRSFGEGGDGYVPGEGVGAVILKPLEKALLDGDQIYAVIKASAINHGGKTNGYTVPNPLAQAELILEVLHRAKVDPAHIGYIETHGTGTSLGDPIEMTGLARAFEGAAGGEGQGTRLCAIGSVKSNIGHLESAAGVAAVTKVLLQFKYGQRVPSLHAERLNPLIDFSTTPFYIQRTLEDWQPLAGRPRCAGVSSFGAGGANAHLILEQFADSRVPAEHSDRPEVFLLSARNHASLVDYAGKMVDFLATTPDLSLLDIVFTSQVGRTSMPERLAIIASSRGTLQDKLSQWLQKSQAGDGQGKRNAPAVIADVYEGSTRDARRSAALIEGEAGRIFLQFTLEQRDLAKLAKLWIAGVEIDWAPLYRMERPRRVSLPTYPFARERYWIDTAAAIPAPSVFPVPSGRKEMLYYRSEWRPASLLAEERGGYLAGPLLFLGADEQLLAEFQRRASQAEVVSVAWADEYRQFGPNAYGVDPRSEADFIALLAALEVQGALPKTIVHCTDGTTEVGRQLDQGIFSLHYLCKAMLRQKSLDRVRIIAVHREAAVPTALHSALAGYFKSLALENPGFPWKVVTVAGHSAPDDMARSLVDELLDAHWRSGEVRYLPTGRSGGPLGLRQVKALSSYGPRAHDETASVKQNGVYIVTGGLGGLGYIFSEHLAKNYGARLVLSGRSALDAKLEGKLAVLKAWGGDAIYVQADIADPEQAAALVHAAKQRFVRLNGVIHSAGVHRDAFILNKTGKEIESVLAAKVMGTINLDQATQGEDLDFFALFSSVAGVFGNLGQSDYAFANHFLDAFAGLRQARVVAGERCGKSLSINWPFWENGGMRISQGDIELMELRSGLTPLPTAKGIRYWETFLQGEESQGIALYGDAGKIDAYVSGSAAAVGPAQLEIPAVDGWSLQDAAENYLKTLLSEQIKLPVERIDSQGRFESFGVDSMMISRINAKLEQDLGDLPKTLFYEYATIEELADYLVREAQPALRRHFVLAAAVPVAAKAADLSVASVISAPLHRPVEVAESIAIIGVHGRFPRSESLQAYWRNLRESRDFVDQVPASRWDADEFFDADPEQAKAGKIYCKWGGFLEDADRFDAAFFGVSREDAAMIDPQERLFIQSVWAAVEDAGYTRVSLKKRHPKAKSADVGVFVGVTSNTYHLLTPEEWRCGNMVSPGSLPWSIANRVSYFFDFQGPSLPVDTACSSSLVAIHMACESLKRQECQLAVAGGVNLYLHPAKYHSLCRRRMLAVNGKCRSFGDGDDGFIPSEGVGAFLLKPLSRAVADGDHIYGVIAASDYEHAGRANGYSAPNPNSQALLIERTLDKAGIDPETISYVEGHGTGTQLGDSLEVASLTQAFRKHTQKKQFCPLGSVKANLGHGESVAGIDGVTKILLQFKHREIVPTLHCDPVNPSIDFASSPFYLQRKLTTWAAPAGHPRRAMINSFGAGGVNACLILEDYEPPAAAAGAVAKGPFLVLLSARNDQRLRESAARLRDYVQAEAGIDLARLAYTMQTGREAMEERLALVVSGVDELLSELSAYSAGTPLANAALGRVEAYRRKKSAKPEEREGWRSMFADGNLVPLGRLWVEGQDMDWDEIHGTDRLSRLPLPTYPFARERYWVSDSPAPKKRLTAGTKTDQLHPLVARNVSTLKDVCFASFLSGQEYYGRDHLVNGERFFPGAGFLEIACISGTIGGEGSVTRIEDIVWVQPLRLGTGDQLVEIFLKTIGDSVEYVIISFDDDNERVVHSEGRLVYGADSLGDSEPASYPVSEIRARAGKTLSGSHCYQQLESLGFHYGPAFQTIQELYVGKDFALSRLELTAALQADFDQYILHPCIIDGALQTVLGMAADEQPDSLYLPFALGAVEILRPVMSTCYAYVEPAARDASASPEIKLFNIRLLSENGEVLVNLENFYVRTPSSVCSGQNPDDAALSLMEG